LGLSAVETLEQEHRLISRVVRLLPAVRRNVDAGAVDEQVLSDIAEFFSAYTDGCHHAKEEDLFFPILLQRGVSSKGCPVGTLRLEHQQGRNIVKALNTAVSKHRAGDAKAAGTISAILKDATELYTDHIWREDYLLFPMSGKVLLDTDREILVKDFEEVQTKFGSAFQDKYEALVEKLEKELGDAAGSEGNAEDISATRRQKECACPQGLMATND
jgi:hemerythrin-like domain-containing protein